jgi:hypothetical protein
LEELANCVLFASGGIDNGGGIEEEEDLRRFLRQEHHPVSSIPITAIQQAARHYRASALLGPVPLHVEGSSQGGAAGAWTNFEEKYHRAGEPTFELVLERRHHAELMDE